MRNSFILTIFLLIICPSLFAQTWIQKNNFPGTSRFGAEHMQIGNFAYLTFGSQGSFFFRETWEYNPTADSWTMVTLFPGPGRWAATSFSTDSLGFAGLGWDGTNPYTDWYSFDPTTNTWTPKASFPGQGSRNCLTAYLNGKAYFGGGAPGNISTSVSDFWEYDVATDTWTLLGNFPLGTRQTGIGFTINDKCYFGFGTNGSASLGDMWRFDPVANTWSQMANFPGLGRIQPSVFVLNGKAIIGGGYQVGSPNIKFADYYEYDPVANSWTSIPSFPNGARGLTMGFSIGNKGYLATGEDGNLNTMNDVWEYSITATSVAENLNSGTYLEVFPSPSNGILNIKYAIKQEEVAHFEVVNNFGQVVFTTSLDQSSGVKTLDLSDLAQGAYFYRMTNGSAMRTGKFSIMH